WHTAYCQNNLSESKQKNLEKLKERIARRNKRAKGKVAKSKNYSRGVDSMFRLTARNQINLSKIADNKSNILISLNGIIISLTLAMLVSKFKEEPAIIIPTVIFILFSLCTVVLAILSTRPNISSGKFTREDILQKKVNLLFFGNFYNMKLDEYEWAVEEMINDDPYLYSSLTKDQYSLGKVLAKKYRLLRWAYNVFMMGLVITVITFLIVYI
ncbi:MAG: phosphohydrolase, partial [Bacteroidales bacterium]|nr:phosphohydrolase [Bacteroidales bacterium]